MKKRFLAVFLALALCLGLMPTVAFADNDIVLEYVQTVPGGTVTYTSTIWGGSRWEGVWYLGKCSEGVKDLTILDRVTYQKDGKDYSGRVKFVGLGDNKHIVNLTLPKNVTAIEGFGFSHCKDLVSITFPGKLTQIGMDAFLYCTSLASFTIPSGITMIDASTFEHCESLTSVTIPDSVTSIRENAFNSCNKLTDVYYGGSRLQWGGIRIFSGNGPLLNGGRAVIHCSDGDIGDESNSVVGDVKIPDGLTQIGSKAFYNCTGLTGVTIPNSVTSIGNNAFFGCTSLTSVTIPDSVTSIGVYAFARCTSLTSVTIPDSVTSIKDSAFYSCTSLTSVTIPSSVTSIENSVFNNCTNLTSVTIPNSVTSIGFSAFGKCDSLTDIYYGGSEEQWEQMKFPFAKGITIHYNSARTKFTDLKSNGFYMDAVEWALGKNITTGKTATTFAPNENCTHAQILTFLWRAAGEPESSAQSPITMKGNEYYYKAAKWAAEKGMIDKNFNPSAPCNRAYAVLYIWQAFGKPAPAKASPFTDIPAHWASATAAAWALANGVTTGTSATTFTPDKICNRSEIVTFLYRAYK